MNKHFKQKNKQKQSNQYLRKHFDTVWSNELIFKGEDFYSSHFCIPAIV